MVKEEKRKLDLADLESRRKADEKFLEAQRIKAEKQRNALIAVTDENQKTVSPIKY